MDYLAITLICQLLPLLLLISFKELRGTANREVAIRLWAELKFGLLPQVFIIMFAYHKPEWKGY